MKITIDTKEDSKEEIQRAIQLLSSLVGESGFKGLRAKEMKPSNDLFSPSAEDSNSSESSGNAFVNMFGSSEVKEEEAPVDLGILSSSSEEDRETEEEDEEVPSVVSY